MAIRGTFAHNLYRTVRFRWINGVWCDHRLPRRRQVDGGVPRWYCRRCGHVMELHF